MMDVCDREVHKSRKRKRKSREGTRGRNAGNGGMTI
jgi:hypothetical protein